MNKKESLIYMICAYARAGKRDKMYSIKTIYQEHAQVI